MKLFIYEKFWDAFLKINRGTQTKVTDFINKFTTNSKSAALNLESISTFKDKSLRTARIDRKYRAIIKEVKPSKLYLLIWIDNHDEAMDWARNKVIDWNEQTQAYQVFTLDEAVVETKPQEEVHQYVVAQFMGKYNQEDLLAVGVPEVLIPSVLKVNNLKGLEKLEEYLPIDAFENLFYLLDGANIQILKNEIKEGVKTENELESKNNARSFIEFTDDAIFNEALSGSLQKWKYYLHPSQSAFVYRNFNGSIKLSGGAGTGKTVAALHRLKFLAENKTDIKPILFTTFTKELSENLDSLARELDVPANSYVVENIDALAFRLAREYNLIDSGDKVFGMSHVGSPETAWEQVLEENLVSFDQDFLQKEFEDVILAQNIKNKKEYLRASRVGRGKPVARRKRLEIWKVIEAFVEHKRKNKLYYKEEIHNLVSTYLKDQGESIYSHVIVDELQDFSNVELNFIRSLKKEGPNDLFMVGDPLQNIYNKRIVFSRAGINIRGQRSKRLRINYRTTEEIKKMALTVIKGEEFSDFDGGVEEKSGYLSLFHGVEPIYQTFRTENEELEYVINDIEKLIENEGFHYNDIVIAARTRDSIKHFRNYFHQEGIPYVTTNLLDGNNEGVRMTTFHGMKGLEFKQVFLMNVNERTLPLKPFNFNDLSPEEQGDILKREKALFYVACSRAIQRLVITGVGTKSELLEK